MNVLIDIDAGLAKPIYRQIVDELTKAIQHGYLQPGEKLPSTRDLGKTLGISRFTVMRSYEDLVSAGYAFIATGSGAYVNKDLDFGRGNTAARAEEATVAEEAKTISLSRFARQMVKARQTEPAASQWHAQLNFGAPDSELLPVSRWKEVLYSAMREIQAETAEKFHDSCGRLELRETVVDYLRRTRRVRCGADRLLLFTSHQSAIDFVLRLLVDAGDHCAVESPGLPDIYRSFLSAGATVHPIAVDYGGASIERLAGIGTALKLIFVSPSLHEPTGVTMSATRREELLAQAELSNAYVVENDLGHEFRYGGKALPAIQGLDSQDRVIYLGSFAQVLGPLSRLAYVVLPEHLLTVGRELKAIIEPDYAPLDQITLARFMQEGHFERHIKRSAEIYSERRACLVHALTAGFGDNINRIVSSSGNYLNVSFHSSMNDGQIANAAQKHGVAMVSLANYYLASDSKSHYLMAFGHLTTEQIATSVAAMAQEINANFLAATNAPSGVLQIF